jgi:catechol 2,3-dioxygenase-like lactoylglutathione lyase family enzyme
VTQAKLQLKAIGINHVVIWVGDLARSRAFYMDLFGMTVAHESATTCFLWCGENHQLALFDSTRCGGGVTSNQELNHLAFLMEPTSYEDTKARLEADGLSVEAGDGDPDCIYINDPDGHRLQVLYKGYDG